MLIFPRALPCCLPDDGRVPIRSLSSQKALQPEMKSLVPSMCRVVVSEYFALLNALPVAERSDDNVGNGRRINAGEGGGLQHKDSCIIIAS